MISMMNMRSACWSMVAILSFLANPLYAQDIFDGWYFNPDEPGNGFNVNTQADITGIALFDFDRNGNNQWAIATDALEITADAAIFQAQLIAPASGACFDCPFRPNEGNVSGDIIRIEFQFLPNNAGNIVARVTLRGVTETYEQLLFRFSGVLDFMLSSWSMLQMQDRISGGVSASVEVIQFDAIGSADGASFGITGKVPFVAGSVLSDDSQPAIAIMITDDLLPPELRGQFPGIVIVFAEDVDGARDQVWAFFAFKQNLIGFTEIGDDPITEIFTNFENADVFIGSRIGDTLNRNEADVLTAQADHTQSKATAKAATPESTALAARLLNRMKNMQVSTQ